MGGTSDLTASTNARKTVRAGKEEILMDEEEEEDESLLRGCYSSYSSCLGLEQHGPDTKFKTRQLINTALH